MEASRDDAPNLGGFRLDHIHGSDGERDLRQATWRGWRRRCPACGTGPMMKGYLKVRDTCTVCGEELHHQRADDGPAYLTILVVGHLMAPLLGAAYMIYRPDPMVLAAAFSIGTVAASLWLLPRFKGMMVGFQWAKRMHGFAPELADDLPDDA
ncbi:DUF983 domain-containing protein [Sinisalibacter aestuarii]|uniref:Zinc-finger protein n=1 Tax=Sinisalibacter aestuarii TaxID=2949426 RepID=A0ABQ5LW46_9RHOB|nr:DUF983 domain-containing protein [Sinisalibacter aestuarii]GKY88600.1 zinc-finger protein [Sinisalibacter aestuarii]